MQHSNPSALQALEAWALQRCPLDQIQRLEPIAEALSQHFTSQRPEAFTPYLNTPDALTTYALLFAPQTYARLTSALQQILLRLPDFPQRPLRVLDLGCGIGSAALAAYDTLLQHTGFAPELTGVDWSTDALQAFQTIHPRAQTIVADLRSFQPTQSYDIILSSFAFNEAFPLLHDAREKLLQLSASLNTESPSFVLLLEPADRIATPRLLALRPHLIQHHLPLYAPCPHASACPMIASQHGICHDVRKFKPARPAILLTRHTKKTLSDVKYTPLAFGRPNGPQAKGYCDPEFIRLVGPVDKGKGLLYTRVCMGDGALRRLEIPNATLSTQRRHKLLERQRGDCAWLDGPIDKRKRIEHDTVQRTADLSFIDEEHLLLDALDSDDAFTFSI